MISSVIQKLNKHLKSELEITKKITYSIESEIKHLGNELPMNYTDSENIKNRINNILDKTFNDMKLENTKLKLIK